MKLAYFPDLLPDELLFSGIAALRRYHEEAHASFVKTTTGIRGSTQAFLGLPTNLQSFVESLPLCSSLTVERIERDHTLAPLIRPFLRSETQENLGQAIQGTVEAARIDCLHEHIVHEDKRLRCCPTCWHDDRKQFGRPYWHRCHQIKHVTACPQHGCQLIASPVSWLTPSLRASFISGEDFTPGTEVTAASPEEIEFANQMRDAMATNTSCNASTLRHAALELLRRRSLLHGDFTIDWQQLRSAVDQRFSKETQERLESESNFLAKTWEALSKPSTRAWLKPHQFYVFTRALGYDLKDLITLTGAQQWETGPWECKNPAAPCNGLPTVERFSLSLDGRAQFTCPSCLGSYLRDLPLGREPDGTFKYEVTLDSKGWRAALPALWHDLTLSLEDIAERLGKSYSEIRSNAAALRLGNRRQCRRAGILNGKAPVNSSALMNRRGTWLKLVAENPGRSKSDLVRDNPSVGEWLYRNDRQWFAENAPAYSKRKRQSTVNYQERDASYAAAVPAIAKEVLEESPPVPISVYALTRRLKLTVSQDVLRELYPRTAAAIDDTIANQPDFIDRALEGITKTWRGRDRIPTWYEFISTRALFARRCTKDGEFRQRVLEYYQHMWPENPNYFAGTLKPVYRRSPALRKLSPEERLANCIYPFGQMTEGASFFVPISERSHEAIRNTVIRTMHHYKSQGLLPKEFLLSAIDAKEAGAPGVRFTRKAAPQKLSVAITVDSATHQPNHRPSIVLPLEQMAVGDSFFLPHDGRMATSTPGVVRSAIKKLKAQARLPENFKVMSRAETKDDVEGIRVWRVSNDQPAAGPIIDLAEEPTMWAI